MMKKIKPTLKQSQPSKSNSSKFSGEKSSKTKENAGSFYLVAVPIGNLGDISFRAVETLKSADLILAEDTRVTHKLLSHYGINGKIIRADEEVAVSAAKKALEILNQGGVVAFCPDAGTPMICDPGSRIAQIILENGFEIYAIPGASALLSAINVSGLDLNQFAFLGFVPNKDGKRNEFLASARNLGLGFVVYETAPRLIKTLEAMGEVFGNLKIAVVRELTKLFEEKKRGNLGEVLEYFKTSQNLKGEFVILVEKPNIEANSKLSNIEDEIIKLSELRPKEIAQILSEKYKIKKSQIYEMALKLRGKIG